MHLTDVVSSISYGNLKWLVLQMVWNRKQISANYFSNICPEVKFNWDFNLLHHVNSKFHYNSLVDWSFASWIDIPSSTFQNIYVLQTAWKFALLKRALEKHGEAMLITLVILKTPVKRLSLKKWLHLGLKKNLFNSSSSTSNGPWWYYYWAMWLED